MNSNYRSIIYQKYTESQSPGLLTFTDSDFRSNSRAIDARINAWLPVEKSIKCLDVACGAGQMVFFLNEKGYNNIWGVDISPQQVDIAKRFSPNIHLGDAIAFLENNKNSFEFITAIDIIEHFNKDELLHFLKALSNALKPGGRLIVQTPNAESPWGLKVRYGDLTHEICFDPNLLKSILTISGFELFEAKECGPYVHGIISFFRVAIWRFISFILRLWNLAEVGNSGSGIYTRVFIAKVDKPKF